jgi:phage baseplate assembly protein W
MTNARWFGFNPPFFGGQEKVLSRQEDEQLIKNDLLQLLLTVPGERVMRPTFGAELRNSVFDMNDSETIDLIRQSMSSAVTENEPRVTLEVLELTRVPDENKLNIYMSVRLRNDPTKVINVERIIDLAFVE